MSKKDAKDGSDMSDHAKLEYNLVLKRGDEVVFKVDDSSGLPYFFNKHMLLSSEEKLVQALDSLADTVKVMLVSLLRKEIDDKLKEEDTDTQMLLPPSSNKELFLNPNEEE